MDKTATTQNKWNQTQDLNVLIRLHCHSSGQAYSWNRFNYNPVPQ